MRKIVPVRRVSEVYIKEYAYSPDLLYTLKPVNFLYQILKLRWVIYLPEPEYDRRYSEEKLWPGKHGNEDE